MSHLLVALCQSERDVPMMPKVATAEPCDHCGLRSLRNQRACFMMGAGKCTKPPRPTGSA